MAGQLGSTSSPLPAAAHVVGNAFVNQYYNVLHQSPQVVHRFYTDASRLTRAEAGVNGAVDTVVSQAEIHQKVMALDYGGLKAEISTVDSQDSLTGGVLVMVTGSLYKKRGGKKKFVQSFFLAPQEKGYFVLNDIFRYVEEEASEIGTQAPVVTNGTRLIPHGQATPEPEPSPVTQQEVREIFPPCMSNAEPMEEVRLPAELVKDSDDNDNDVLEDGSCEETAADMNEPASPRAELSVPVSSVEDTTEEAPKKSYASIVSYASILRMKENAGSVPSQCYVDASKVMAASADQVAPHSSRPMNATTSQDHVDEGSSNAIDGRSVYVKNLPTSISPSQLEEEFGKFGLLKPGGVNVKSQKQGVCYAFVDFEETASAQTAIELSPIAIGGRQVYVEEKRPVGLKAGGRGGRLPAVGRSDRSFRNDGLRRGSPASRGLGGRGSGQDRDREAQLKVRGTVSARSGSGSFVGGLTNNVGDTGALETDTSLMDNNGRDSPGGINHRASNRSLGNRATRNAPISRRIATVSAI